jgi:hypothetical protein
MEKVHDAMNWGTSFFLGIVNFYGSRTSWTIAKNGISGSGFTDRDRDCLTVSTVRPC